MTKVIAESLEYDITVTESPDYKGKPRYVVRYGLEVKKCQTLREAVTAFVACLGHATNYDGDDHDY
jgi:hypothetical protein